MFPILTTSIAGQIHLLPVPQQMALLPALNHAGSLLLMASTGGIPVETVRDEMKQLLPVFGPAAGLHRVAAEVALFASGKNCHPSFLGHMGKVLCQTAEFLNRQNMLPPPSDFDEKDWEKFEAQPTLPGLRALSRRPKISARPASTEHEICSVCDSESPRGHKFCGECGNPFGKWIEEALAKFCHDCGQPNKDPASKIKSDNREVTTFISDIRGFSLIGDILAPDQLAWLMERTLIESRRIITNLKGYVALFEGDKIVSFWDLYKTRGDASKRAVAAACQIHRLMEQVNQAPEYQKIRERYAKHPQVLAWQREHLGEDLFDIKFRIGINTGPVTRIVLDKPTAFGSSINVAARLEAMASPGRTLIGRATRERLNGGFEVIPQGFARVKNIQQPVEYFLVSRETPTGEDLVPRRSGQMTFVGRGGELTFLKKTFQSMLAGLDNPDVTGEIFPPTPEQIAADGKHLARARVVILSGEAGLGKTTLASRFLDELGKEQNAVSFWTLRGDDLNVQSPDRAIAQVIRHKALIQSGDTLGDQRRKIISFIQTHLAGTDEEMEMHIQLLGRLLDVAFDRPPPGMKFLLKNPSLLRERTLETLIALFERMTRTRPAVVVLEDLHWMDEGSLEYIERLLENLPDRPIFVLGLTRPSATDSPTYADPTFRLLQSAVGVEVVPLTHLDDDSRKELVNQVLGRPTTAEEWSFLSRQTDNTFLFGLLLSQLQKGAVLKKDEMTSSLQLASPDGQIVPLDAHEILQGQIDELSDEERRLIEIGAILGFEFSQSSLQSIFVGETSGMTKALADKGFLIPLDGDRFRFRHALQRDEVLEMMKGSDKQTLHFQVGSHLESERSKDHSLLALHFEKGGVPEKAASHHHEAADAARSSGHTEAAIRFYNKAHDVTADPHEKMRHIRGLHDLLIHNLILGNPEVSVHLEGVHRLSEAALGMMESPSPLETAWLKFRRARSLIYQVSFSDENQQQQSQGAAFQIPMLLAEARQLVEKESNQQGREVEFLKAGILNDQGMLYMRMGMYPMAKDTLLEGLAIAQRLKSPIHEARLLTLLAWTEYRMAGYEKGLDYARKATELFLSEQDLLVFQARTSWGYCLLHLGLHEDLERFLTETEDLLHRYFPNQRPYLEFYTLRARLHHESGRIDEAIAETEAALEKKPNANERMNMSLALAESYLKKGEISKARERLETSLRSVNPRIVEDLLAHKTILAKIHLAEGRLDQALAESQESLAFFRQLGNARLSGLEVFLIHASVLGALERYEEAFQAIDEAASALVKRTDGFRNPTARQSFQNVPVNREIVALHRMLKLKLQLRKALPSEEIDEPFRRRIERLNMPLPGNYGPEIRRELAFLDGKNRRKLNVELGETEARAAVDVFAPMAAILSGVRRMWAHSDERIEHDFFKGVWTQNLELQSFAEAKDDKIHLHMKWDLGAPLGSHWLLLPLVGQQRQFEELLEGNLEEKDGALVLSLKRDPRESARPLHGGEIRLSQSLRLPAHSYIFAPISLYFVAQSEDVTTVMIKMGMSVFTSNVEKLSGIILSAITSRVHRS